VSDLLLLSDAQCGLLEAVFSISRASPSATRNMPKVFWMMMAAARRRLRCPTSGGGAIAPHSRETTLLSSATICGDPSAKRTVCE